MATVDASSRIGTRDQRRAVQPSYTPMNDALTQDEGTAFGARSAHAFLVIHVDGMERPSRVIELPDATESDRPVVAINAHTLATILRGVAK